MMYLYLRSNLRRLAGLAAFAMLFLLSGLAARFLVGTEHGHVELGNLYLVGGYPLVSAMLLLGWMLGRYALVATLVMFAGIVSSDRVNGTMRLYAVRPRWVGLMYLKKYLIAAIIVFAMSAILMPAFDMILLGQWAGPGTFVLIVSYIFVYGSLTFLLSVWFRGEVWIAIILAITAMLWDALIRSGVIAKAAPGFRELVTILLPPQSALFRLETAFGADSPIPWDSFVFVVAYGLIITIAALVSLRIREL